VAKYATACRRLPAEPDSDSFHKPFQRRSPGERQHLVIFLVRPHPRSSSSQLTLCDEHFEDALKNVLDKAHAWFYPWGRASSRSTLSKHLGALGWSTLRTRRARGLTLPRPHTTASSPRSIAESCFHT
jgi:hypothetical protein